MKSIKLKNINNFLYLSRNYNIIGLQILKSLIRINKKPSYLILPKIKKDRKVKYNKKIFNSEKEPLEKIARSENLKVIRVNSFNSKFILKLIKKKDIRFIFIGGGWPEIMKNKILRLPKIIIINTHPSLLPNYRGADVHRWQILNNEKIFGITFHFVDKFIDSGRIIFKRKIFASINNPIKLTVKLSKIASNSIKTLFNKNLAITYRNQKSVKIIYKRWNWFDKKFFFIKKKDFESIENFVNASYNLPNNFNGPFIKIKDKKIIIRSAKIVDKTINFGKDNVKLFKNFFALKLKLKNKMCKVKSIQLFEDKSWNKNENKSKLINKNFENFFN